MRKLNSSGQGNKLQRKAHARLPQFDLSLRTFLFVHTANPHPCRILPKPRLPFNVSVRDFETPNRF